MTKRLRVLVIKVKEVKENRNDGGEGISQSTEIKFVNDVIIAAKTMVDSVTNLNRHKDFKSFLKSSFSRTVFETFLKSLLIIMCHMHQQCLVPNNQNSFDYKFPSPVFQLTLVRHSCIQQIIE